MFEMTRELVETLGINTDRIKLKWISSAEGNLFAKVAQEFTQQIKSLGPLNLFEQTQAQGVQA